MEEEKRKAIDIFDIKRFFSWFNKNDIAALENIVKDIANENVDFGCDICSESLPVERQALCIRFPERSNGKLDS